MSVFRKKSAVNICVYAHTWQNGVKALIYAQLSICEKNFCRKYIIRFSCHCFLQRKRNKKGGNSRMKFNPGETAPKTGTYNVVDSNGKVMNTAEVKKGQTLPPTQSSKWHYEID